MSISSGSRANSPAFPTPVLPTLDEEMGAGALSLDEALSDAHTNPDRGSNPDSEQSPQTLFLDREVPVDVQHKQKGCKEIIRNFSKNGASSIVSNIGSIAGASFGRIGALAGSVIGALAGESSAAVINAVTVKSLIGKDSKCLCRRVEGVRVEEKPFKEMVSLEFQSNKLSIITSIAVAIITAIAIYFLSIHLDSIPTCPGNISSEEFSSMLHSEGLDPFFDTPEDLDNAQKLWEDALDTNAFIPSLTELKKTGITIGASLGANIIARQLIRGVGSVVKACGKDVHSTFIFSKAELLKDIQENFILTGAGFASSIETDVNSTILTCIIAGAAHLVATVTIAQGITLIKVLNRKHFRKTIIRHISTARSMSTELAASPQRLNELENAVNSSNLQMWHLNAVLKGVNSFRRMITAGRAQDQEESRLLSEPTTPVLVDDQNSDGKTSATEGDTSARTTPNHVALDIEENEERETSPGSNSESSSEVPVLEPNDHSRFLEKDLSGTLSVHSPRRSTPASIGCDSQFTTYQMAGRYNTPERLERFAKHVEPFQSDHSLGNSLAQVLYRINSADLNGYATLFQNDSTEPHRRVSLPHVSMRAHRRLVMTQKTTASVYFRLLNEDATVDTTPSLHLAAQTSQDTHPSQEGSSEEASSERSSPESTRLSPISPESLPSERSTPISARLTPAPSSERSTPIALKRLSPDSVTLPIVDPSIIEKTQQAKGEQQDHRFVVDITHAAIVETDDNFMPKTYKTHSPKLGGNGRKKFTPNLGSLSEIDEDTLSPLTPRQGRKKYNSALGIQKRITEELTPLRRSRAKARTLESPRTERSVISAAENQLQEREGMKDLVTSSRKLEEVFDAAAKEHNLKNNTADIDSDSDVEEVRNVDMNDVEALALVFDGDF